eukprot:8191760-Lingulodinium_polyedra.AAC.1
MEQTPNAIMRGDHKRYTTETRKQTPELGITMMKTKTHEQLPDVMGSASKRMVQRNERNKGNWKQST